jgi:predicted nucleic acid-binding protein
MTLFVDSSTLYAAANAADRNHERARLVLSGGEPLVTTDHALVETWLLANARLGRHAAEKLGRGVMESVEVEMVGSADLAAAWEIGEAFPDQSFSLVDRTSFAVMQRLGIDRAAAFDDDFAIFRFGPGRTRAFEIVR